MSDFVLTLSNIKLDAATEARISAALQNALHAELQHPEVLRQIGDGALALRLPKGINGGRWAILSSALAKDLEQKKALPGQAVNLNFG